MNRKQPKPYVGWMCRDCWRTGTSEIKNIARMQHNDAIVNDQNYRGGAHHENAIAHDPTLVMREELSHVEFEGLVGEKQRLNLDSGEPIQL